MSPDERQLYETLIRLLKGVLRTFEELLKKQK